MMSETRNTEACVEGIFALVLKVAGRISELSKEEIAALKQMATAFPETTSRERTELTEAMLEVVWPE